MEKFFVIVTSIIRLLSVSIRGCKDVTDKGFQNILSLSLLQNLNLRLCQKISDSALELVIASLGNLAVLDIRFLISLALRLTNFNTFHRNNHEVHELNLDFKRSSCCSFHDRSIERLCSMPHLKQVSLRGCRCSQSCVKSLGRTIKINDYILYLPSIVCELFISFLVQLGDLQIP